MYSCNAISSDQIKFPTLKVCCMYNANMHTVTDLQIKNKAFFAIGKLCCQCIFLSELLYVKHILIVNLLIKSMALDPSLKAVNVLVTSFLSTIGLVKQKNVCIKLPFFILSISLNMCFGCSKEPSHRDRSFEYPPHLLWLRNNKNNFQLQTLIWGL